MNINVSVKSIGKRKNVISKHRMQLPFAPSSLKVLLSEIIKQNIEQLEEKQEENNIFIYLTKSEVESQALNGKVGFGTIYNPKQPDLTESIKTATQAFEDGLFRVFVNNEEVEELDTPLEMDSDEVVFIRLTMLAGRMW